MPIFHLYFLPECTVGRIWGYGLLFHLNCVYEKREYKYKCANLNATKHRDTEAQSPWLHRTRERNKFCASVSLCLKSFHFDASPRCHPEGAHDTRRETHARCIVTAIATTAPTMSETTTASILSLFHKKASNSHVTTKQTRKAHKKVKKCCFIIMLIVFLLLSVWWIIYIFIGLWRLPLTWHRRSDGGMRKRKGWNRAHKR